MGLDGRPENQARWHLPGFPAIGYAAGMSKIDRSRRYAAIRRRSSLPRAGRRGFTIIEVALATLVMALGISTCLTALQSGLKAVDTARNTTLASQILQSQMEVIRLQNWSQIQALPSTYTAQGGVAITAGSSATPTALDNRLIAIANRFTFVRTISDVTVGGVARPHIKSILLAVTWTGIDGRAHTRSYQLRYAKNGLNDYFYVSH